MDADEVKQIAESGDPQYLKFVKIDGVYRFSDAAATYSPGHEQLAANQPVESAGFVKIYPDGLFTEGYSSSLNIGPDENDEANGPIC